VVVGAVAAVAVVLPVVLPVVLAVVLVGGELGLLVARLRAGGRRGRGFAGGVVDGDRDADRAAALAAQRLADDRREAAFEYALREFVRYGEQGGVGDQCEGLAAADPVLVLRLDPLPTAPVEELLEYSWPHCGKIGRYVSHRARSLTGSHDRVVVGRVGIQRGWGGDMGTNRSSAKVVRATGAVQVVVPSLWIVSPGDPWFDRMA
jgi:hypothetical protein